MNPDLEREKKGIGSSRTFRTFSQVVRQESAKLLSLVRIQQGAHYQALTAARGARGHKSLNIKHLKIINIQLTKISNGVILLA